jgi:acetyltransferase-like isoleucine patch superfamily enzyme
MFHPTAIVESAHVGVGTRVWAYAHVLEHAQVGANCNLGDHTFVEGGARIGNNVTIKNQVCVWDGVVLEDNVFIGPRVTFTNDRYPRSPRMPGAEQRYSHQENWLETTFVREGCSIGAAAVVLPGLELGAYSVVAAGAVVTRDVAPFSLVVGTPARHVAWVCRCGQPLDGTYRECTCPSCGETPAQRLETILV